MTQHVPSPAPETMLAHRHFIRSIVRSLLRSRDGEDDVVQQAMVQAWQHGGKRRGRLEPWLARICRNLAFDHLRAARQTTFGPFDVGAGPGTLEVLPTLRHGVTVRGRVTGLAEAAGRSVRAWCVSRMLEQSEAQVQPDLTFTLSGLGEGTWRVTLATEGGRSHSTEVIVATQAVEGVVLAVRSGSGSIRCTVHGLDRGHAQVSTITAAGQPRTGASLTFENGAFVLEGLPPGRYRVTVHAEDWPNEGTAEVSVESGEATVAVEYKKRR